MNTKFVFYSGGKDKYERDFIKNSKKEYSYLLKIVKKKNNSVLFHLVVNESFNSSIEREIRSEMTEKADELAVQARQYLQASERSVSIVKK